MTTNPQLLSCATLPTNDVKLTAQLAQALAPFSQEVADQLLHPTALHVSEARSAKRTLEALALVPEPARSQEDDQEDDQEEKDQEELALATATASQILVQLQHPSSHRVPEPSLQDKVLVHAADAATSFLLKQHQHNQGWSLSLVAAMDPTSRAVERIFAVVKLFLARNSQMRIEVLNSLIVLHDVPLQQQVDMWVAYHNHSIIQRARKALKDNPTFKEVDLVFYAKLMEKAEQAEEKVDDRKKERMVTEYLINKGLLPATHSHKRAKKDDMTKALTPTTLRRI